MELVQIEEEAATLESLYEAFAKIEQRGPYDLQLVYLSGHGLVNAQSAGFVMQPSIGSISPGLRAHTTATGAGQRRRFHKGGDAAGCAGDAAN